jgi:sugar/nucleoside kinase (ribokinase family)
MPRFDITIAGEVNLDIILYGLPGELPPERELLATGLTTTLGGASAIVAHNLAVLGNLVGFQSVVGEDALGQIALERLQRSGVDTLVRKAPPPAQTGLTIVLQRDPWRNILTYPGTIADLKWDDLDFDYLSDSRHFHLSSYFLQTALLPRVPELLKKLKDSGLTISLDTNDDPEDIFQSGLQDVLPLVDVFLPNARELMRIAGTVDVNTALVKVAQLVPLLVVKLGHNGAMAQRGNERFLSAPIRLQAVDAVGAGDSFDAGFLTKYVQGADIETCLAYGNLCGAFSATRAGGTTAFLETKHREKFFSDHGLEQDSLSTK